MKYLNLLVLTIFLYTGTSLYSQTIDIGDGVTVAHFNAGWNDANSVSWIGDLEECNVVKVDIVAYKKMQTNHKIVVVIKSLLNVVTFAVYNQLLISFEK